MQDHLLKVFVRLNPGNPNEAPLGTLLSDPVVQEYLNLSSNYGLPVSTIHTFNLVLYSI